MSRPSNNQPSQAAIPDFHCSGERSRKRSTSLVEATATWDSGKTGGVWRLSINVCPSYPRTSLEVQQFCWRRFFFVASAFCHFLVRFWPQTAMTREDGACASKGELLRLRH